MELDLREKLCTWSAGILLALAPASFAQAQVLGVAPGPPLPTGRAQQLTVAGADGVIYLFGGFEASQLPRVACSRRHRRQSNPSCGAFRSPKRGAWRGFGPGDNGPRPHGSAEHGELTQREQAAGGPVRLPIESIDGHRRRGEWVSPRFELPRQV